MIAPFVAASQQGANPFAPPRATVHYAPDRTYDLQHVSIALDVDYPNRTYTGRAVNTLSPLRAGLTEIMLNAGPILQISKVTVDGRSAPTRRDARKLFITVPPTKRGATLKVAIDYKGVNSKAASFGSVGGFHWIETPKDGPATRVGFWTQGETEFNSDWVPTWDYPNDFATYDETYTVQSDWTAIGNGKLVRESKSADGKRKTFVWKQDLPHATYLLTAVGGPFDIKKDAWRGKPLWYVVPKGQGKYIEASFAHTPDMLTFFSDRLGYEYPWAKYAQNSMYDFGGGMENVSATTLGERSLSDPRDSLRGRTSLTSHELAHQWFGDTVTCQDWGDIFNNESFATFLQMLYSQHREGENAYLWEVNGNQGGYLNEARRYKRPIITNLYSNGDAMFDAHTYPKGGVVLHTLRRLMGDDAFFAGLTNYLHTYEHTPVQSAQLERSIEQATGMNVEWFFDQWFRKPGHPVLTYDWAYADGKVTVTIAQTQDTSDGTPIYRVPNATLGFIAGSRMTKMPFVLDGKDQTVVLPASAKPDAVVLDPDHDFLRVATRVSARTETENVAILNGVADPVQRAAAMTELVSAGTPSGLAAVVAAVSSDRSVDPAFVNLSALAGLKKPELRSFWLDEIRNGKEPERRAAAVAALGMLPADPATTSVLRGLVNEKEFISVVVASVRALATVDKVANRDVFERAVKIEDRRGRIAAAAKAALGTAAG